jgi:hypothetical protein
MRKVTIDKGWENIDVYVSYPTDKSAEKIYWLHVQPYEIQDRGEYKIKLVVPSKGYRFAIERAARFSQKRLEALAVDEDVLLRAESMYRNVLRDEADAHPAF